MFTDIIDGKCGYYGDAVLYSLHKMLPISQGGMLIMNEKISACDLDICEEALAAYLSYDFRRISEKRKYNASKWNKLLHNSERIQLLRDYDPSLTYQTFPVIIESKEIRDKLYFKLNEYGYGGVSLYHELIRPLYTDDYMDSIYLSDHIFNLPVHQDIDTQSIEGMFELLMKIVKE